MTDDRLFGERDLEQENHVLRKANKRSESTEEINMSEADYCILGEGFCQWCRYCIIRRINE